MWLKKHPNLHEVLAWITVFVTSGMCSFDVLFGCGIIKAVLDGISLREMLFPCCSFLIVLIIIIILMIIMIKTPLVSSFIKGDK